MDEEQQLLNPNKEEKDDVVAIELRDVHRGFGLTKVIRGLNIRVQKGTIYGLLGPSGCGKTTILNMIIGRLVPDRGTVHILGGSPHSRGVDVPGGNVGFSPQETALYYDLSVRETLAFHGLMQGMTPARLRDRVRWLRTFLELPPLGRIVRFLSGGQKRRVSLAVAMLHDPKILILDEPTVGLDPMLRFRIWQHLRQLAMAGTTVVITTHYIGEAEEADCVGLMRGGCILDVGHPKALLKAYRKSSLEDVFLLLCQRQDLSREEGVDDGEMPPSMLQQPSAAEEEEESSMGGNGLHVRNSTRGGSIQDSKEYGRDGGFGATFSSPALPAHAMEFPSSPAYSPAYLPHYASTKSLEAVSAASSSKLSLVTGFLWYWLRPVFHSLIIALRKMFQLSRNYPALMFELLIPSIQVFLFLVAIGPDPQNLGFQVVNLDGGNPFQLNGPIYGDLYVQGLADSNVLDVQYNGDLDDALQHVKDGRAWGVMLIPQYFSVALPLRNLLPENAWVQEQSTIGLYLDLSDYEITIAIEKQVDEALVGLLQQQFNVSASAVVIREAVYGNTDVKFISFLAPGLITSITVSHSIGATALSFLVEKTTGTLDRLFSVGVNSIAMQMGHFTAHTLILLLQTVLMLLVAVLGFGVPVQGSILLVFFFLIELGGVGMALGLIISTVAHDEVAAIQFAMALFFPTLLLSGILWPVQAIPWWFRPISMALPTTWTAEAMRSVMIRGWGFSYQTIWVAALVNLAWFVAFMAVAIVLLRTVDRRLLYRISPSLADKFYSSLSKLPLLKSN